MLLCDIIFSFSSSLYVDLAGLPAALLVHLGEMQPPRVHFDSFECVFFVFWLIAPDVFIAVDGRYAIFTLLPSSRWRHSV